MDPLEVALLDAENWTCSVCGEVCQPLTPGWRFGFRDIGNSGPRIWEHYHDEVYYPAGRNPVFGDDDSIEIEGTLMRETQLAYLVDYEGEEIWFPKSAVNVVTRDGDELTLEVPEWLAQEKGL